ncbi:MAG: hypothetical protein QOJ99_4715 [Bryobacterales bacterium]|jgi:hypothetical protein|nr:hypothetical protein [Bryobacterales bacterium]
MKKVLCIALLATSCGVQQTRLRVTMEGVGAQPVGVSEPTPGETVHRVLRNGEGKILFAYDLEAHKTSAGLYRLSLKPSEQKPTFETAREVTVGSQESVRVDLMEKPGTGQKISDVFSVTNDAPMAHLRQLHNHLYRMVHGN